jgi:RNA polymerase sigma factor (sigma-70 family)
VEASTITATAAPAQRRVPSARLVAGPLLRLRSDEQLVRLFRTGSEEAFRVVHDRYRTRLLAYARQMLGPARADAEDVLQDVFVRAYAALRANERDVSLRAWLYRIAHNRCIDELRRPASGQDGSPEALELMAAPGSDPATAVEQRESLRRLVADVQRLPDQQRSALLMREISGMPYQDLAAVLDVTVPAVKSLLVRARVGLAQAAEARDTACAAIRADLADAHERGVRASGLARRHLHDCTGCRAYRRELKALDARLAALVPVVGPVALLAKLLGIGGGGAAAGGGMGAAGGGAATAGVGAATASVGAGVGAAGISVSHVAAVVAVAVVGAGGAVEVKRTLAPEAKRPAAQHAAPTPYAGAPASTSLMRATGSAALVPGIERSRRRPGDEAASLLRLRIAPPPATTTDPVPTTGALAEAPGNGGAAAPVEPTREPVVPEPSPEPIATGDDGAASGSPGVPTPAPASPSEPAPPAAETPPPASSVTPAPPVASAPPTSATTGGAAFAPPQRRHR